MKSKYIYRGPKALFKAALTGFAIMTRKTNIKGLMRDIFTYVRKGDKIVCVPNARLMAVVPTSGVTADDYFMVFDDGTTRISVSDTVSVEAPRSLLGVPDNVDIPQSIGKRRFLRPLNQLYVPTSEISAVALENQFKIVATVYQELTPYSQVPYADKDYLRITDWPSPEYDNYAYKDHVHRYSFEFRVDMSEFKYRLVPVATMDELYPILSVDLLNGNTSLSSSNIAAGWQPDVTRHYSQDRKSSEHNKIEWRSNHIWVEITPLIQRVTVPHPDGGTVAALTQQRKIIVTHPDAPVGATHTVNTYIGLNSSIQPVRQAYLINNLIKPLSDLKAVCQLYYVIYDQVAASSTGVVETVYIDLTETETGLSISMTGSTQFYPVPTVDYGWSGAPYVVEYADEVHSYYRYTYAETSDTQDYSDAPVKIVIPRSGAPVVYSSTIIASGSRPGNVLPIRTGRPGERLGAIPYNWETIPTPFEPDVAYGAALRIQNVTEFGAQAYMINVVTQRYLATMVTRDIDTGATISTENYPVQKANTTQLSTRSLSIAELATTPTATVTEAARQVMLQSFVRHAGYGFEGSNYAPKIFGTQTHQRNLYITIEGGEPVQYHYVMYSGTRVLLQRLQLAYTTDVPEEMINEFLARAYPTQSINIAGQVQIGHSLMGTTPRGVYIMRYHTDVRSARSSPTSQIYFDYIGVDGVYRVRPDGVEVVAEFTKMDGQEFVNLTVYSTVREDIIEILSTAAAGFRTYTYYRVNTGELLLQYTEAVSNSFGGETNKYSTPSTLFDAPNSCIRVGTQQLKYNETTNAWDVTTVDATSVTFFQLAAVFSIYSITSRWNFSMWAWYSTTNTNMTHRLEDLWVSELESATGQTFIY